MWHEHKISHQTYVTSHSPKKRKKMKLETVQSNLLGIHDCNLYFLHTSRFPLHPYTRTPTKGIKWRVFRTVWQHQAPPSIPHKARLQVQHSQDCLACFALDILSPSSRMWRRYWKSGWVDGSVGKVPHSQMWDPEFRYPILPQKLGVVAHFYHLGAIEQRWILGTELTVSKDKMEDWQDGSVVKDAAESDNLILRNRMVEREIQLPQAICWLLHTHTQNTCTYIISGIFKK